MPNSTRTIQESVNDITLWLNHIIAKAARPPATRKDLAILDYAKNIKESVKDIQDKIRYRQE